MQVSQVYHPYMEEYSFDFSNDGLVKLKAWREEVSSSLPFIDIVLSLGSFFPFRLFLAVEATTH